VVSENSKIYVKKCAKTRSDRRGIVSILSLNSSYIWAGPKDWKNYNDLKKKIKNKVKRIIFLKKKKKNSM
jgi:hypothetical protein